MTYAATNSPVVRSLTGMVTPATPLSQADIVTAACSLTTGASVVGAAEIETSVVEADAPDMLP